MPSETEEIWRYSGIDHFDLDRFAPSVTRTPAVTTPVADAGVLQAARSAADRIGRRSGLVVTVDGVVVALETAGEEAQVGLALSRAATTESALVGLGSLAVASDAFGELHDAFLADAVLVEVSPNVTLADPVVVVHVVGSSGVDGSASFPRTVIRVATGARCGVVELAVSTGAEPAGEALVIPITELDVADGGSLAYANVQAVHRRCTHIAVQASRVGRHGELQSFSLAAGGHYARLRTDAAVVGTGGRSALLAAFLGVGDQVLDFRTRQEHDAARSHSELLFKGAVADTARSVYSGLIQIRPGAKGTTAFQTNHNLVLSEGARADSVPNLDIAENDVRCSHASTVGPIDEEQRYYLESRGIDPEVAERLVVGGFFTDLAQRSPFDGVSRWVEEIVTERLAGRTLAVTGADRG
jgi:Fe-S cluster assembly protein SufD